MKIHFRCMLRSYVYRVCMEHRYTVEHTLTAIINPKTYVYHPIVYDVVCLRGGGHKHTFLFWAINLREESYRITTIVFKDSML